jgi:hypothetical protein
MLRILIQIVGLGLPPAGHAAGHAAHSVHHTLLGVFGHAIRGLVRRLRFAIIHGRFGLRISIIHGRFGLRIPIIHGRFRLRISVSSGGFRSVLRGVGGLRVRRLRGLRGLSRPGRFVALPGNLLVQQAKQDHHA